MVDVIDPGYRIVVQRNNNITRLETGNVGGAIPCHVEYLHSGVLLELEISHDSHRQGDVLPGDTKKAAGNERMFTVQVELRVKPDCDGWMQPGPFASLVRERPAGPWLIQAFNTGP